MPQCGMHEILMNLHICLLYTSRPLYSSSFLLPLETLFDVHSGVFDFFWKKYQLLGVFDKISERTEN